MTIETTSQFGLTPEPARLDRRILLSLGVVALIAYVFWTSSRYPALDEKASLGGDNDMAGLAFDEIVSVSASDGVIWQIIGNTLNWAYTNKQGMFFGVLFAAATMTLLQTLSRKQFRSRIGNTLLGMAIGAPLGVCVNCAVPIAMGVKSAGARTETALAALFTSPSLNMVVLGMTFAIFPFWVAALKVSVTIAFILLCVPFAVARFGQGLDADQEALDDISDATPVVAEKANPTQDMLFAYDPNAGRSWTASLVWTAKGFLRNLWYIAKLTVPLMILAGFLGAIAITLLPWAQLAAIIPSAGWAWVIGILLVAIIGTFLPVPMAFDVVICSVLLIAGVDVAYVAALLVTLGLYSIYPGLQISHSLSRSLAIGLGGLVALTGAIAGFSAHYLGNWDAVRQQSAIETILSDADASPDSRPSQSAAFDTPAAVGERAEAQAHAVSVSGNAGGVTVLRQPFADPSPSHASGRLFGMQYGPDLGITIGEDVSPLRFIEPVARARSIATGDLDGDGWPDVAITTDEGLSLFRNLGDGRFASMAGPEIEDPAPTPSLVALTDVDGDADLDILLGTHLRGLLLAENEAGRFGKAGALPGYREGAHVSALAIGDIDRDGWIDIVVGNSSIGNNPTDRSADTSANYVLSRVDGEWAATPLEGPEGETLSILLSDLNDDGWLDVYVGNDFNPPDHLWLSDGAGALQRAPKSTLADGSTRWTMSLDSADIDGDGRLEVYAGNISGRPTAEARDSAVECRFETGPERAACETRLERMRPFFAARFEGNATGCRRLEDPRMADGCALTALTQPIIRRGPTGPEAVGDLCERIPQAWPKLIKLCELRRSMVLTELDREEKAVTLRSGNRSNMLLRRSGDDMVFVDGAVDWGVDNAGWTWNAKFADIDLDGRQDLYVVNGYVIAKNRYDDRFFRNTGTSFENVAEAEGLGSGVPTVGFSYVDLDRDGDLDILTLPMMGPLKVFTNAASNESNSLVIELRNRSANSAAIGSRVTLVAGDRRQVQEVQASGGFVSFDETDLHFGLGRNEQADRIEVRWPDGAISVLEGPFPAGATYRVQRDG